ncbi:hypothetical protein F4810DRAFT_653037 [Camillea tinctor]|nr:hypothetical protein F4810DRAFT_653037 [Camillea tinctor]
MKANEETDYWWNYNERDELEHRYGGYGYWAGIDGPPGSSPIDIPPRKGGRR